MTNVEALKALHAALGGDAADVADATTITAVLNAIAAKYEGADDATTNAEAITNITAVLDNIIPEPSTRIELMTSDSISTGDELFICNSDDKTYIFGYFKTAKGGDVVATYPDDFTPAKTTRIKACFIHGGNDTVLLITPTFDTTNHTVTLSGSSTILNNVTYSVIITLGD